MRVLVFDDDAAIGRVVARVAIMTGFDVVTVTEPETFQQNLRCNPPQVVILDLQLGITDGVEQLRLLTELRYTGHVVLMSGFDSRVLDTARALGSDLGLNIHGVLEKPLRINQIEQMLAQINGRNQPLTAGQVMEGIANDEFALEFQPVVSRKARELKKLEALVRWDHPIRGRIPPSDFLPAAEQDVATIDALTNWVTGATIDAYLVLKALGIEVPLAMNVSPCNLHDLTLPDRLAQRARDSGMPPAHLSLELTETAAFADVGRTMDVLTRLRLKGMKLSIDDFGTGYSSLKLLRQMPFSEIKIDQSFIKDAKGSRDAMAIVKFIIEMAASMKMGCVAEGVETEEIGDLIDQVGDCDLQGYFIARPMPVEAVYPWLKLWAPAQVDQSAAPCQTPDHGAAAPAPGTEIRKPVPGASAVHPAAKLTPQQLVVMRLLADGFSAKEIARKLNLGVGTVKVHVARAYSTLGARNRVEAVTRALPLLQAST